MVTKIEGHRYSQSTEPALKVACLYEQRQLR